MASLSKFQANKKMANDGVPVPFGDPDPTTGKQPEFIVAYSGNESYRAKLAEVMRRASRQMPGREIPNKTVLALQREAMIGTVLLGWNGINEEDADGNEIPGKPLVFNPQNAAKVLGTPVLYGIIENASSDLSQFQEDKEAASKAAVKSGGDLEPAVQLGTGEPVSVQGGGDQSPGAGRGEPAEPQG